MGEFSQLKAQFDPINQQRKGRQFEEVCKWFLQNDSTQYKERLRRVWLWNDWPHKWGIDAGIDLVAEDIDGGYWAIQAKAYEKTISRAEVNKFLAEAGRYDFTHKLLIATTDDVSRTAERTMEDLRVSFIGLTELEEFPDWPEKLSDLRPAKPPQPKEPWDYQRAAVDDVLKGFEKADRGQLIMACGTGKTLVAWFINEELDAKRTLVLVPSLSLLKQTLKEWRTANPNRSFEAMPVCSDDTVRREDNEDEAISHVSYLGEPAETDPDKIAEFLRRRSGSRVVFATYQSSPQIAEAFTRGRVPAFDLVIADEAHRIAGPVYSSGGREKEISAFATVLDKKKIKAARRLFMTATPRYYTGRLIREGQEADQEIASMDNPEKFGEEFHRLGFSEAIHKRRLTDYQVAIIGVTDDTYRDWAEEGRFITLNGKKRDARSLAGQIGLAQAMRKFDLRRVITFHNLVGDADKFAKSIQPVMDWMPTRMKPSGSLWARHASGKMSAKKRHDLLQHLKRLDEGDRGLLANARCLSEGVDVPALDGVAFIAPRRAEADIIQAVGRAIRKSDTKEIGTIVIPVFIDTDEDADVALDASVFQPVWDVLKALRAHDEELGRQLDGLRQQLGRQNRGKLRIPRKVKFYFPPAVQADFAEAFSVRLVEQTTAPWQYWYGLLSKYYEREGHTMVPVDYVEDGKRLGNWTAVQRANKAFLTKERVELLDEFPDWIWGSRLEAAWSRNIRLIGRFIQREGHSNPSLRHVEDGVQLGMWAANQRALNARGKLSDERKQELNAIPGWTWDPRSDRWNNFYKVMVKYAEREGHSSVPGRHVEEGLKLGAWVNGQRQKYAKHELSQERIDMLAALAGWKWDEIEDAWERNFQALKSFIAREGHSRVPRTHIENGLRLGAWMTFQRGNKDTMSDNRRQRLEDIPQWTWTPHSDRWEMSYEVMKRYVAREGHALVPALHVEDGVRLGSWVNQQRTNHRQGKLSEDRQKRLEDIRGWVWVHPRAAKAKATQESRRKR